MNGFCIVLWAILSAFVFGIGLSKNKLYISLPSVTSLVLSMVAGVIWIIERSK